MYTTMAVLARIDKFTSPRQIKRNCKLELNVSARTIGRRLQELEAGLFGRVARVRHKRGYSEAELQLRKPLAFAEGYKSWTRSQWENFKVL